MERKPQPPLVHTVSKFVGGALLALAVLGFIWFIFFQHPTIDTPVHWTIPYVSSTATAVSQHASLQAVGITLSQADQPSPISEKQALQLASQLQPDAAVQAKKVVAQYVLLNAPAVSNGQKSAQGNAGIHDDPVWMVWYQQIPQQSNGVAVDAAPAHDLYMFIDAKTGAQVLAIWV